jgi:Arc/MetJ-type ribon-helix-helix transcriptional regulator
MSTDLSPEHEQFIQQVIASGVFPDREHALHEAIELLRKRQALLEHVDEGTRQLQSGEYHDYDQAGLRCFFDDVKVRGRKRYDDARNH